MRLPRWTLPLGCVLAAALVTAGLIQAFRSSNDAANGGSVVAPAGPAASLTASPGAGPGTGGSDRRSGSPAPLNPGSDADASTPKRVAISTIGLSAAVVPVGLASNGNMDIPPVDLAGWYRLGPVPGDPGPAVLVGHVDSRSGPAVFYRLSAVRAGDIITVTRADGRSVRFVASATTRTAKTAFPSDSVFAPTDQPTLRLITCAGAFDRRSGHYTDSLIVWATAAPS